MAGPPLISQEAPRGFGDFGWIWVNADATNLYVGGHGMDIGGSNNAVMLFLGVDTLTDNAWNLWHKAGPPNALDFLHNVRFTEPMDVALMLGDTYGDGPAYTNFIWGGRAATISGKACGTSAPTGGNSPPMADAQLSQFHGTGTDAVRDGREQHEPADHAAGRRRCRGAR
jgi:hypothetical protein